MLALKELLHNLKDRNWDVNPIYSIDENEAKKIIEGIEAINKWIPCSERLPEKNGAYLITGRQGAVNKQKYYDGHWYGNWSVLAWMPLPEHYKAESEE